MKRLVYALRALLIHALARSLASLGSVQFHISVQSIGTFLVILGLVSVVPALLVNRYLWMRFTAMYERTSPNTMPFLPLDFRGRWLQVLGIPTDDPVAERARMRLRLSQRLLYFPFAFMLGGMALIAVS
jgi:hypothetical protein